MRETDRYEKVAAALVNLSPSTNHAVKIGYASWKPADLAANAEKVVSVGFLCLALLLNLINSVPQVMVNKLISGGRKNIRVCL